MARSLLLSLSVLILSSCVVNAQLNVNNAENMAGVPLITVDKLPWYEPVQLNCSAHVDTVTDDIYPPDSVPDQWLLPRTSDGVIPIVGKGETINYGNIIVSDDAMFLTINNITVDNFGLYHCMRTTSEVEGGYYLVRIGVNTAGPYFQDIWTLWYKKDTFQGLFGFTLSIAIICGTIVIYGMVQEGLSEDTEEEVMDVKHAAKFQESSNIAYIPDSPSTNVYSMADASTFF